MKSMYERAIDWIRVRASNHGEAAELMRRAQAQAQKPSWYKLLQGKSVRAENLFTWLENLGFKLLTPDEAIPVPSDAAESFSREKELEGQISLLLKLNEKYLAELDNTKILLREAEKEGKQKDQQLYDAQQEIISMLRGETTYSQPEAPSDTAARENVKSYGIGGKNLLQETPARYNAKKKKK